MTREMAIIDGSGDTKLIWDSNKSAEVENARQTFINLKAQGYVAFSVTGKEGVKGERMSEFHPDTERMIMVPPMVGG